MRLTVMAVNMETATPRPREKAKPFTVALPRKKRMQEVMMTVMFASKMVTKARLKPACTARRRILPAAISSLNRSK